MNAKRADIAALKSQLRRREAEVAALQRIAMAIASAEDLPEILQTIVHLATQVMECPKAAIFELDEKEGLLYLRAWEGLGEGYAEAARVIEAQSRRGAAVLSGQPVAVPDLFAEPTAKELVGMARAEGYRSVIDVPLRSRGTNLGLLSAYFAEVHEFAPAEIEMFVSFADQAAVALETARLLRDQERRIAELSSLEEVGRAISGTLDMDELLDCIHGQVGRLMDATNFYIALYDEAQDEVSFPLAVEHGERRVWRPRRAGQGLTEYIIRTGEPLLLKRDVQAQLEARGIQAIGPQASSWLGVPMQVGDKLIGMVAVQSYNDGTWYDEDHERILLAIVRQAAVAIQNARTVAEIRQLNRDLQQTLSTQEQLLATISELSMPVVPLLNGIILLPLVGHIDSERARQVVDRILAGVEQYQARVAILDITGVPVVDTRVAQALLMATQAVQLLGAQTVLVGIKPEVAETMVELGIDLSTTVTRADLQGGLVYAMEQLRRARRRRSRGAR